MINVFKVRDFRAFESFEMRGLGRINLLVGGNNSGKTSLLEGIELLLAHGDPRSIWVALNRRGERLYEEEERRSSVELDICRLFHGHVMTQGRSFEISADNSVSSQSLTAGLIELDEKEWTQALLPPFETQQEFSSLALELKWKGESKSEDPIVLPITERGGLSIDLLRRRPPRKEEPRQPVAFVSMKWTPLIGQEERSIKI